MTTEREELAELIGQDVILDTRGPLIYIGRLEAVGDCFYTVADCDVHDGSEGGTSKEVYSMETAKHGVRINRSQVYVRKAEIVSLSKLSDVIKY